MKLFNTLVRHFSIRYPKSINRKFNNTNNNLNVYKYIDAKVDSKFSEIKFMIFELKSDMKNFENEIKSDMKNFKTEIKSDIQNFKTEIKSDMKNFETEIKSDMKNFETQISTKLISKSIAAGASVFAALSTTVLLLSNMGIEFKPPQIKLKYEYTNLKTNV